MGPTPTILSVEEEVLVVEVVEVVEVEVNARHE